MIVIVCVDQRWSGA